MSYNDMMQATESGTAVELFEIRAGESVSRYTNGRAPVMFDGAEYVPAPIKHDALSSKDNGTTETTVSAPYSAELTRYVSHNPTKPTTIKILRYFEEIADDYRVIFQGRVVDITLKDKVATAKCESGSGLLQTRIPRRIFSAYCQHNLFDAGCGLSKVTLRTTLSGVIQDGTALSCGADVSSKPANWFTGGFVEIGDEYRLITKHDGEVLHLQVPFPASALESGVAMYAYPGCDKSCDTCSVKFNNLRPGNGCGFLGMPTIPSKNPAIWGLR